MSAFERADVIHLAESRRSLNIILNGKAYYVNVKDIHRALEDPNFRASILKLTESNPPIIENQAEAAL